MTTLITGAGGYLGSRLVAALGDEPILAVRLRDPEPFSHVDPRRITRIIHTSANTKFNVDRETAERVNVAGTARVLEFAARCDRLERLVYLSTLYTAGRRHGEVREERHTDAGFVNHYEWSKWAGEELLLGRSSPPVTIVRLPTVIAEDDSGTIGQHNVFHHTLRLFFRGLLTLLPGEPATPLSFATAEFTVAAVLALLDAEPGIYQACSRPIRLDTAIETAFAVFERDDGFRRRMLARPLPCDRDSFHDLVTAARGLRGGPLSKALASVAPFAEQLYLPKVFRTDRLRAAWPGYRAADPVALVESVCHHLIAGRVHAAAH